jgi:hypothetical protein
VDLLRHTKYTLADQFQVQRVDEQLVCVVGPFSFADGQPIELYLREDAAGLELLYYSGLAEALTLEALYDLRAGRGAALFEREGLRLYPDRLGMRGAREALLEDVVRFALALRELDLLARPEAEA